MADAAPVFDHRDDGTPAARWGAARAAVPRRPLVGSHDHLIVLAAHPDDETLGAGGLIAEAASSGAQVTVVVATDGEGSHPRSPSHSPDQLASIRRGEVHAAVTALAPDARLVLWQRPDGTLTDADLIDELGELARDATVLVAPWRRDGHPDHEACGRAAADVAHRLGLRLLEYPIWGWHWGRPGTDGPLATPDWVSQPLSEAAVAAKRVAIAAHRSQHTALSTAPGDEPVVGEPMRRHFTSDHEVFHTEGPVDLAASYFERLYTAEPDPWRIESGFYETRKRELLLAALPRPRFRSAFEPGCARGRTTIELAVRCDRLVAMDASPTAAAAARARTAAEDHVTVNVGSVPQDWPTGTFDLVVVSEVGYYLAAPGRLAERARASLSSDGVIAACHWRHPAAGYPSTAAQVHDALSHDLYPLVHHEERDFVLDVWSRDPVSVAEAGGVVT